MALVIYLISNLMKLTLVIQNELPWPRLAIQLSKEQKETPQQIVGASNLFYAQFVVS